MPLERSLGLTASTVLAADWDALRRHLVARPDTAWPVMRSTALIPLFHYHDAADSPFDPATIIRHGLTARTKSAAALAKMAWRSWCTLGGTETECPDCLCGDLAKRRAEKA